MVCSYIVLCSSAGFQPHLIGKMVNSNTIDYGLLSAFIKRHKIAKQLHIIDIKRGLYINCSSNSCTHYVKNKIVIPTLLHPTSTED